MFDASLYSADPLHATLSLNSDEVMSTLFAATNTAPPNPSSDASSLLPSLLYMALVLALLFVNLELSITVFSPLTYIAPPLVFN